MYTSEVVEKSANNQEFVLGNKAWNAEEHVGDTLCVEFQGHSECHFRVMSSLDTSKCVLASVSASCISAIVFFPIHITTTNMMGLVSSTGLEPC